MKIEVGTSSEAITESIRVRTRTRYVSERSDPQKGLYFFAYTIAISNEGSQAAQLKSRHWIIKDANGKLDEVKGPGVVGEFPYLQEGDSYEYTSFCVLATTMGSMKGSYQFTRPDGTEFDVAIAEFQLVLPGTLN
jgi:ApaG protein